MQDSKLNERWSGHLNPDPGPHPPHRSLPWVKTTAKLSARGPWRSPWPCPASHPHSAKPMALLCVAHRRLWAHFPQLSPCACSSPRGARVSWGRLSWVTLQVETPVGSSPAPPPGLHPNCQPAASALLQTPPGLSQKPEDPKIFVLSLFWRWLFLQGPSSNPLLSPSPHCYSDEILYLQEQGLLLCCLPPPPSLFSSHPPSLPASLPPFLRHHFPSSLPAFLCQLPLTYFIPLCFRGEGETPRDKPMHLNQSRQSWHLILGLFKSLRFHSTAGKLRTQASVGKRNCHCSVSIFPRSSFLWRYGEWPWAAQENRCVCSNVLAARTPPEESLVKDD